MREKNLKRVLILDPTIRDELKYVGFTCNRIIPYPFYLETTPMYLTDYSGQASELGTFEDTLSTGSTLICYGRLLVRKETHAFNGDLLAQTLKAILPDTLLAALHIRARAEGASDTMVWLGEHLRQLASPVLCHPYEIWASGVGGSLWIGRKWDQRKGVVIDSSANNLARGMSVVSMQARELMKQNSPEAAMALLKQHFSDVTLTPLYPEGDLSESR